MANNISSEQIPHKYRNRFLRDSGAGSVGGTSNTSTASNTAPFEPHYLWGQYFDDTKDIVGDLIGVGSINASGRVSADTIVSNIISGGDISASTAMLSSGIASPFGSIGIVSGTTLIYHDADLTTMTAQTLNAHDGSISSLSASAISAESETVSSLTGNNVTVSGKLTADKLQAVSGYIQTLLGDTWTVENLTVTKAAHFFKLMIDEIKASQGQVIITPANAVIDKVETVNGNYRCYYRASDADGRQIYNSFEVNDQVICQTFDASTGTTYNSANRYYWRLVVGTGSTSTTIDGQTVDVHYFDLSDSDKDSASISAPQRGDNCVLLGNRTDTTRQAAIIISAYNSEFLDAGLKAPSIAQYNGINSYSLSGHRMNVFSKDLNEFTGTFKTSTGNDIEDLLESVTSGVTTYLHCAYSNSYDGTVDFTKGNPSGGNYTHLGLCSNQTRTDDNLQPSDYSWSRIKGVDGDTPYISNGYWYIGGTNTNVKAEGANGTDGYTPYISNGYWYINGENTGIRAEGVDGQSGYTHYIYNDYWYINGESTGVRAAGKDGLNGTNGVDGASGTSSYFHIAYANKNGSTITDFSLDNPTNRDYIGTYVDNIQADSTNPNSYSWQLVRGEQGISGYSGTDGKTSYLHIKYSNDGGNSFTSNSGETVGKYIGQYVDFISGDSNSVSSYKWALIKGTDGDTPTIINGYWYINGESTGVMAEGVNGTDGYTPYISNGYWYINGESTGIRAEGVNGVSITGVTEYYLLSSASANVTTATTGWQTTFSAPTSSKKYCWNFEEAHFSDGSTSKTNPVIISTFAKDGLGVSALTEYYKVSTASTGVLNTDSGWSTAVPTLTSSNKFLWNYEQTTWNDGSTAKTDAVVIGVYGDKGDKGDKGDNGVSLTSVTEYYLISSSSANVTTATTGWQTSFVSPTASKKYLWNYEQINLSDGTAKKTTPAIIGNYSADGASGRGISSITEYYKAHSANTNVTTATTGWSTAVPTLTSSNKYLWNYELVTYTDGATAKTTPVVIGVYGDKGDKGDKGDSGTSITISSTSITYAVTTATTQPTDSKFTYTSVPSVSAGDFLWCKTIVAYSNGSSTKSYSVSRIGSDGSNGTNGTNGTNGHDSYLHIAYSTSSNGSANFSTTYFTGALYIGTCVNTTSADPTSYSSYSWARLKGEQGESGVSVSISSTSVTYALTWNNSQPSDSSFSYTSMPSVSKGQYLWTKTIVTYTDGKSTKTYTVSYQGIDGQDGSDGSNGTNGSDGQDAEFYRLTPVIEKAIVDKNGTLGVQMQYQIVHVKGSGATAVTASSGGLYIRLKPDNSSTYYNLSYSSTPSFTNSAFLSNYHKASSKPVYFTAYLVSGSTTNIKDQRVIPVSFDAGASLEITDSINATVQGHTTNISSLSGTVTSHTNSISTLNANYNSISSTVQSNTTNINSLSGTVTGYSSSISSIQQKADQIESTVNTTNELLLNGDKNNYFRTTAFDGGELATGNKWEFRTSVSDYVYDEYTDYGTCFVNGACTIEHNSAGYSYVYSPYFYFSSNQTYTLSCDVEAISPYPFKISFERFSNLTAAKACSGTTTALTLTTTYSDFESVYGEDVFTAKTSTSGYYRLRFALTTTSSSVGYMWIGYLALYYGSKAASDFAAEYKVYQNSQSKITQRANSIEIGLNRAGISLTNGKITSVADNFQWKDNSGNTILGIDSTTQQAVFAGTVKAKNFYHSICNFMEGGTYKDGDGETWAYCSNANTSDYIYSYGMRTGKYYSLTQLKQLSGNYYSSFPAGFFICSYQADIVNMMPKTTNWSDTTAVMLPRPDDFEGKVVEVFAFAYGSTAKSVYVGCVTSSKFANGVYWNGSNLSIQGSSLSTVTITTGTRTFFYAVKCGSLYYWIKMHSA